MFSFTDGSLDGEGKAVNQYLQNGNYTPPWKQWNYQVVRYDGTQYVHKLNAEQLAALNRNSITNIQDVTLFVGNSGRTSADAYPGKIDEIRFSSVARSDDWIKATYDSIKDSNFASFGSAKRRAGFLIVIR